MWTWPREVGRRLQGADRDGGIAVQRVAELVERQGLDVELDVGPLLLGSSG
jgi:hypothetical protein